MTRRTYIVVFRENSLRDADQLKFLADALDEGEKLFCFDFNIAFLQTRQNVETLTARLRAGRLGQSDLFFLADITNSPRAGNMVPAFWNLLHNQDKLVAVS
ncbi:MAG: hypothetical protein ACLPSF_14265 [Methylocella sp.]